MRWWGRSTTEFPPLIVICGATATGKTRLSLALAQSIPGAEIISADSRQVYRAMDIGTAKVSAEQRALVPHHGLDLADPDETFTAADYQQAATSALTAIAARGGTALLVGGTGLYLRAVARGMALSDTGQDTVARADLERRLAGEGLHVLVAQLRSAAPGVAAQTDLANPRRVVRALERVSLHGDAPPPAPRGYPAQSVWIGLQLEPAVHRGWISSRARAQFASGLLDEAAALRSRYDAALPAFTAFGYHEAFAVLDGVLSLEQAIERDATRTWQFARRQRTWFRSEPDVKWFDPAARLEDVRDYVLRVSGLG
ncbi:MAG: tRNA (adenosine(37)-N6)-dimethylallyltransferase MiaA [Chloroflexota bacterium]|nr:tRNA (adenosine(37)-N6)-dimethylallyltransferase MiaA [Chloroflexota bacterium]